MFTRPTASVASFWRWFIFSSFSDQRLKWSTNRPGNTHRSSFFAFLSSWLEVFPRSVLPFLCSFGLVCSSMASLIPVQGTQSQQQLNNDNNPFSRHSVAILLCSSTVSVTWERMWQERPPFPLHSEKNLRQYTQNATQNLQIFEVKGKFCSIGNRGYTFSSNRSSYNLVGHSIFIDEGTGRHWGHVPPKVLQWTKKCPFHFQKISLIFLRKRCFRNFVPLVFLHNRMIFFTLYIKIIIECCCNMSHCL